MERWEPPDELRITEDNLPELEARLEFDLHDLEIQQSEFTRETFKRLSGKQRKRLERMLSQDEKSDFRQIYDNFCTWKDPTCYDDEIAQTHEFLAMRALNIPVDVRNGGTDADVPTRRQKRAFKQLYIITQGFFEIHYSKKGETATKEVYRGIREKSIASIVAQMIDNPDRDQCFFHTSVLSNHTGLESVGFYHADSIVVNWRAPREEIALAADRLCNTPANEDELQIVGGTIKVGSRAVLHKGTQSGDTRRLQTLIRRFDDPESLSNIEHQDVADLIEIMEYHNEPVVTREGAQRLEQWIQEVNTREIYSAEKMKTLRDQVRYLKEAGQGKKRDTPA